MMEEAIKEVYKDMPGLLEEVLEWGEAVILAAPAEVARKLLGQFPVPEREKPLVVATKGLIDLTIYNRFSHGANFRAGVC